MTRSVAGHRLKAAPCIVFYYILVVLAGEGQFNVQRMIVIPLAASAAAATSSVDTKDLATINGTMAYYYYGCKPGFVQNNLIFSEFSF